MTPTDPIFSCVSSKNKGGRTTEAWTVFAASKWHFAEISYDREWYVKDGSINDLKLMVLSAITEGGNK